VLRLAIAGVLHRRTPPERAPFRWRPWIVAPAVVAVTALLLWGQVPLRLRFAASRAELDRFARRVVAAPGPEMTDDGWLRADQQPASAGLFEVTDVERTRGGMRFVVPGTGFLARGGFAYSPGRRPTAHGSSRFRALDGPWFVYIEDNW
jgi:hypothetical protein